MKLTKKKEPRWMWVTAVLLLVIAGLSVCWFLKRKPAVVTEPTSLPGVSESLQTETMEEELLKIDLGDFEADLEALDEEAAGL